MTAESLETAVDPMEIVRRAAPVDGEPVLMMPAEAYTSPEVLEWERRHLFAGSWSCLGRVDDLFPECDRQVRQRAVTVGDIRALLMSDGETVRMYANTCRHRGHELLPDGGTSDRRKLSCPYHGWTYDLAGQLVGAPGFRDVEGFELAEHGLVELPVRVWQGWVFGHAVHRLGSPEAPSFEEHLGAFDAVLAPYAPGTLAVGDRHTYEVAANWKVIAENYHECYHCPLIHPELCQVTPPTSGDNYDLPGGWVGGSMVLRDGMRTMSLTGELAATPLPGAPPTTVEYVHLLPNLLVSAHPDYVMTHRMVPLAPDRTWVECSWLVLPGADGSVPDAAAAVEFWDLTNKQDWAACESVQRGLSSPHFQPGPFAPSEDAVARLVSMIGRAYRTGRLVSTTSG
jgi:Rieske 2Fe-2S family protein